MAPEVVKQTAYTKKADIWSVGCLVVEMLTGEHPWAQLTQMQAIFKVGSTFCTAFVNNTDPCCHRLVHLLSHKSPRTFLPSVLTSSRRRSSSITKLDHLLKTCSNILGSQTIQLLSVNNLPMSNLCFSFLHTYTLLYHSFSFYVLASPFALPYPAYR